MIELLSFISERKKYKMLFNLYSDVAGTQLLGWLCVFIGLIVLNEIGRRTKVGGIAVFMVIPAILTVYFILAYFGLFGGKENLTVKYMSGWFHYFKLYAATIGCIGFIMIKYQWGIGAKEWFKPWPFVIVAANIVIAVVSDFESLAKGGMNGGWWGIYSSKNKRQDMLWPDMTCWFILAYDVWNFEYTYCIWKRWNKLNFGYVQHSYGTLPVWNSLRSCCRRYYCQHGNYS